MIKGINLINKIIEFIELTPNENKWDFKSLENETSSLLRLKQIDVLIKLFNLRAKSEEISIKEEIKQIINGDIFTTLNIEITHETNQFVHKFLISKNLEKEYLNKIRQSEIKFIFPKLINYKVQLNKLLTYNSNWLECSPTFNLAYFQLLLVEDINKNLIGKYRDLDEIIEIIINPSKLQYTENELVEKYNYIPEDELREIDIDNW